MKAILTFALKAPISFTEENITEVERLKFTPCKENDLSVTGFSETVAGDFVSDISGNTVLVVTTQCKKVNKNELKAKLKVRIEKFEDKFGKVTKEDTDSMSGEIVRELLPKTYPEEPKDSLVVFTDSLLLIEAASYDKAEEIVGYLRNILGSLPAIPLQTTKNPDEVLGDIILDNKTEFTLGNKVIISTDCVDKEGKPHKGKSSFAKDNVTDAETKRLIKTGSFVDVINLGYEQMSFNLKPDLSISGVKFDKDLTSDVDKDDGYGSFLLQLNEIELMVTELVDTFGGIVE